MLFQLGIAMSVKVQYLSPRGKSHQFRIRVPANLVQHYGKEEIRKSLGKDRKAAAKQAEELARKYHAEFKLLTEGKPITPADIAAAGRMIAEEYAGNLDLFIDTIIEPARTQYADAQDSPEHRDETYHDAPPSKYLKPEQLQAWQILANPDEFRLSSALKLYLKHHQRGAEESFIIKSSRDWNALIAITGD